MQSRSSFIIIVDVESFLRYNGFLPQGDRGRRRSKFVLTKRSEHNGVKRSKHYIVQSPETSHAILDATQHSISYTLSRNQAVIVEYQEDEHTDMFQVRRLTTHKSFPLPTSKVSLKTPSLFFRSAVLLSRRSISSWWTRCLVIRKTQKWCRVQYRDLLVES